MIYKEIFMTSSFDIPSATARRPDESSMRQAPKNQAGLQLDDAADHTEVSRSSTDDDDGVTPAFIQPSSPAPNYRRSLFRR